MSADRPDWMAPGRSRVASFIVVPDAMRVVSFAEEVFGATRNSRPLMRADGRLWNVELNIGDCTVMIGDGGTQMVRPAFLYVQVSDVQAVYDRALGAGAKPIAPPEMRFYGAVDGGVEDEAGNWWWISTHEETLDPAEIESRARAQEATA